MSADHPYSLAYERDGVVYVSGAAAIDADHNPILGDADSLERLVLNLLDNAIKYTRPEGTVLLRLFETGSEVILEGVRFLASRSRLVAEPAGGAAVGALLSGAVKPRPGDNVVAIVSGGNVDLTRLAEFFQA